MLTLFFLEKNCLNYLNVITLRCLFTLTHIKKDLFSDVRLKGLNHPVLI
jgi:hypothetical protein